MIRGARAGVTAVVLLNALLPRDAMSAGEVPVDLKLVLAVDASSSMDIYEQKLQRNGYAAAFRSPAVIAAIMSGARRRIAVSYVEWGDPENQIVVVPWTVVDGADSSNQLAARLAAAPLNRFFGTSIAQRGHQPFGPLGVCTMHKENTAAETGNHVRGLRSLPPPEDDAGWQSEIEWRQIQDGHQTDIVACTAFFHAA